MAYSGRYKVKNPDKYKGDHTKVIYRSMWEKYAFEWCDSNADIKYWHSEETVVPYLYEVDKKYHRYFMDLKITYASGRTILVEIKPDKETRPPAGDRRTKKYISEGLTYIKNRNKWSAAEKYAADNGWEFQIWTEKNGSPLQGLIPKSAKPLKKLKPFPRKKKDPKC